MSSMHEAGQACNNCGAAITPPARREPADADANTVDAAPPPVVTAVPLSLAEQLTEAEADEGNNPTDESPIAQILAFALGAGPGGLVAALLTGIEDRLFAYDQHRDLEFANELIEDVRRKIIAVRLLQSAERHAVRKVAPDQAPTGAT